MIRLFWFSNLLTGLFLALAVGVVHAQHAAVVAPNVYKVLTENDHVRVLEATYQPGQLDDWHGHPPYLLYVVDSGKIQVESENGEARKFDVKAGQNLLAPHVGKHRGKNVGTTPIRLLIIEFKQP